MVQFDLTTVFMVLTVAAFSSLSFFLATSSYARHKKKHATSRLVDRAEETVFIFKGPKLVDATQPALRFFDMPVSDANARSALLKKLKEIAPDFASELLAFFGSEKPTTLSVRTLTGRLSLSSRVDKGLNRIAIDDDPLNEIAGPREAVDFQATKQELDTLREIVDACPILSWRQDSSGAITWANRAYIDTLKASRVEGEELQWPLPALFNAEPPEGFGGERRSVRSSIRSAGTDKDIWFEPVSFARENGVSLHFAIHANPLVQAEEALRNFVQTLTKTFAHLPIGLAIFDKERQLALFNPALLDLTTLQPEWLSKRPSLHSFLDQLREKRQMPEPKDYASWRNDMAALERDAQDGCYEENWSLPSGQTYKVIGRPHPEGAIAFLFEDISSSVSLQRRFRTELGLSQSVIDHLPEAIVVFDSADMLVMSNTAFSSLWGVDPTSTIGQLALRDIAKIWQARCKQNAAWNDLNSYFQNRNTLDEWHGVFQLANNGRRVTAKFSRLPGGAILGTFSSQATRVNEKMRQLDYVE